MIRFVIDTNVPVSAALKDREPEAIILFVAGRDDMEWTVSSEIMTETPLNDHSFCYSIPKADLRKIRNRLIRKDPGI